MLADLDYDGSGQLIFAGQNCRKLATQFATPVYIYNLTRPVTRFQQLTATAASAGIAKLAIHYAIKANNSLPILHRLAAVGCNADIVSIGEWQRAQAAGFKPAQIVFSGVGKTDSELSAALAAQIGQINIESVAEFHACCQLLNHSSHSPNLLLRYNPHTDSGGHPHITTAKRDSKFGIPAAGIIDLFRTTPQASKLITGIALHIGSQIHDWRKYQPAVTSLQSLLQQLHREFSWQATILDLGGGFGVAELPQAEQFDFAAYFQLLRQNFSHYKAKLIIEPGRSLVAEAGILLTRVIRCKHGEDKKFVIVDAAMNDLLRPALYQARHPVLPVWRKGQAAIQQDIVGPVCESTDIFCRDYPLPPLATDDLLVFANTGAYCGVLASSYNERDLIGEVVIDQRTNATGTAVSTVRWSRRPVTANERIKRELTDYHAFASAIQ